MRTISLFLLLIVSVSFTASENKIVAELIQKASSENKHIAVYFSGSDWCTVCKKFKKEILDVEEVKTLLNDKFVFYTADFPQRTKLEKDVLEANEKFAEKLNESGSFPLLVVMDANWKIKSVIAYGKKAADVVFELNKSI